MSFMAKPFSHTLPFGMSTPADVLSKAERQLLNFRPQIGGVKLPAGQKDIFVKLAAKGTLKYKDKIASEANALAVMSSNVSPFGPSKVMKDSVVDYF
jgi:hypothetical protein